MTGPGTGTPVACAIASPNSPEAFAALGRAEREKYRVIVREAGLTPQ